MVKDKKPHFMHWPKNIRPVIQTQPTFNRTNCFKRNKNQNNLEAHKNSFSQSYVIYRRKLQFPSIFSHYLKIQEESIVIFQISFPKLLDYLHLKIKNNWQASDLSREEKEKTDPSL